MLSNVFILLMMIVHGTQQINTDNTCVVCYEKDFALEIKTNCNHKFCSICLVEWYKQQTLTDEAKFTCPCCRQQLPEDTNAYEYTLLKNVEDLTFQEKSFVFPALPLCSKITIEDISKCVKSGVDVNSVNLSTALIGAIVKNNLQMVQWLVEEEGADIQVTNVKGMSPFQAAVYTGHVKIVEFLIKKAGIEEIYKVDNHGNHALHCASEYGHCDVIELLLEKGGKENIDKTEKHGFTALHLACIVEKLDVIKLLMYHGANINHVNGEFGTPFHQVIGRGRLDIVTYLYENYQIELTTPQMCTSYTLSITLGKIEIFEYLFQNSKIPATPLVLISAVASNQIQIVEKLLKQNVGQEIETGNALHAAAFGGNLEMMKILFEHGGKEHIDKVDTKGSTALHVICGSPNVNVEMIKFLLQNGADINALNIYGEEPLLYAITQGYFEVVKLLVPLYKTKELFHKNINGLTPLGAAELYGHQEIAKFLSDIVHPYQLALRKRQHLVIGLTFAIIAFFAKKY